MEVSGISPWMGPVAISLTISRPSKYCPEICSECPRKFLPYLKLRTVYAFKIFRMDVIVMK